MAAYTSEVSIRASSSRVFDVLTKPEWVALWQFGRMLNTTWQAGSEIRFRTEWDHGKRVLEQWGTVLDVRPGERVEYSLFTPMRDSADAIENYCVTRYFLSSDGADTKVVLVQQDNRPNAFVPESLRNILLSLKQVAEGS